MVGMRPRHTDTRHSTHDTRHTIRHTQHTHIAHDTHTLTGHLRHTTRTTHTTHTTHYKCTTNNDDPTHTKHYAHQLTFDVHLQCTYRTPPMQNTHTTSTHHTDTLCIPSTHTHEHTHTFLSSPSRCADTLQGCTTSKQFYTSANLCIHSVVHTTGTFEQPHLYTVRAIGN